MYIKQIDVDNFKTFATRVEIPLLKGFSTIVGPNGSGKSNIIDAVLFALGLAKSRALRGEKLEDFVSHHTKRTEAFVKVTFAECDGDPDFSVARRIKKTSQGYISTYYLDDKVTTHTDILIKLEKYNVTPNSYNVVMQGDITSIVNSNDSERRKIIDEIAGVADFDRQITQASEKLDKVEESVKFRTNILNEVQTRLESLKEEKEVALKYQKLKDEKSNLESQASTVKFFDIKTKLEQAHSNILEFQKKQKKEKDNSKDLEERLNLVKTEYEKINKTVQEKGGSHLAEMQGKLESCKTDISTKQNAITYEEKTIQEKKQTIENSNNGIEQNKSQIEVANQTIKAREVDIKTVEAELEKQRAERERITKDIMGISESAELQFQKREELRKELDILKDKELSLAQKRIPLETDLKTAKDKLAAAQKGVDEYDSLKDDFEDKKDKLLLQVDQLTTECNDAKIIQTNAINESEKISDELTDLDFNISAARKQIYKLEADKNASEISSGNRAIQTIENAHIKGVHAPLYKLGNVDKEYATALEVAVGGRMANIVVDDPDVGSSVIETVRSAGAGRVTCLPLSKLKPAPKSLNLPRDKGVIDYAINLIDFDDIYLDAFFYAVSDTIIVEDDRVAKGLINRYRMVTLNGTLYEKSGAMTGGNKVQSSLKFAVNDDDSELEKYRKRLADMEEKQRKLKDKKVEVEEKQKKAREDYSRALDELNKANIELASLSRSFDTSKNSYDQNLETIKLTKPEIEKIEKQLDKLEESNFQINEDTLKLKEKIDEIEKLLEDSDLDKLKELTAGIEEEITRLDSNKRTYEGEIATQNMKITFYNTTIDNHKETIKSCEQAIIESEKNKKLFESDIKSLETKKEEYEVQVAEIKEKLDDLLTQQQEINEKLLQLQTDHNLKLKELDDIAEQIESFKARRREIEPQLDDAKKELEDAGVDIDKLKPVTMSIDELNAKIQRLSKRMDDLGAVNMKAIEDFEIVSKREKDLKDKIDTLVREREGIIERMKGYEQLKKDAFLTTYNNINANFKEIYHQLSGGEGSLIIDNEKDPFAGGMTIEAKPGEKPKCKLKGLSGGEQSVAGSALVFAIQKYLPAPFYALDEVDASLDSMNVERLAHIVQSQSDNTQFIVVSHRKPMIEAADRTIGVTQKVKGISKVTGVKLRD